ncbi:MAG: hypothetical protein ACRD5J_18300, partial [Nitrososphaeraceae archaeon]
AYEGTYVQHVHENKSLNRFCISIVKVPSSNSTQHRKPVYVIYITSDVHAQMSCYNRLMKNHITRLIRFS